MFSEMPILQGFQRKSVKENRSKKAGKYKTDTAFV